MKNRDVYIKKLKLNPKYIDDPKVTLMLMKPGTLSKEEKNWLRSYVAILELKDFTTPKVEKNRLSEEFIKSLQKEKNRC